MADFTKAERTRTLDEAAPRNVTAAALAGAALTVENAVLTRALVPSLVPWTIIGGEIVSAAAPVPSATAGLTTVNCCRYGSAAPAPPFARQSQANTPAMVNTSPAGTVAAAPMPATLSTCVMVLLTLR